MASKTSHPATLKMPRAARSFTLAFGLFRIDVAWAPLFTEKKGITGHKCCPEHHGQVRQAWYCEHGDHYVPATDLDTLYDYAGESVRLLDSEIVAAESSRDGVVALRKSVEVGEIDPSYYEKAYLLWPQAGSMNEQAFLALALAMRNHGTALVGEVVISKTDKMLVIRWSPEHGCLIAHTCNYAETMKDTSPVQDGMAAWSQPSPEVVAQAELLLQAIAGDFDPSMIEDTYQARLADILAAKVQGTTYEAEPVQAPEHAPDLLAALRATIAEAQAAKGAA